jgi:hypothetical protein
MGCSSSWQRITRGRDLEISAQYRGAIAGEVLHDLFDEDLDSVAVNLDAAIRSAAAPLRPETRNDNG